MSIQGNLRTVSMDKLLRWLTEEPLTGTLVLRNGRAEKRIVFRRGRMVLASSNERREFLSRYVALDPVFRRRTGMAELIELYERDPSVPFGQRLVAAGLVDRTELRGLLRTKVEDTIYELFRWTEGAFELLEGDVRFSEVEDLEIDTSFVILEGSRRVDELARDQAVFPDPAQTVRVVGSVEPESALEQRILDLARRGSTLAEICALAYPVDFPVYATLRRWHDAGLVRGGKVRPGALAPEAPVDVAEVVHRPPRTNELPSRGSLIDDRYQVRRLALLDGKVAHYLALDCKLQEEVDLVIVSPPERDPVGYLLRLKEEIQQVSHLSHPSVARSRDAGSWRGFFYQVLDLPVGARLSEPGTLERVVGDRQRALGVARAVLEACAAAHDRGLFHGDLKPERIVVGPEAPAVVTDFGLAAALTDLGIDERTSRLGLPRYAPPEVLEGTVAPSAGADVYALGCLIHHLLVGRAPFPGEDLGELRRAHERTPRPRSLASTVRGLPKGLADTVDRALDPDPARRPTVGALLSALTQAEERGGVPRGPMVLLAAALVIVTIIAAVALRRGRTEHPDSIEAHLDRARAAADLAARAAEELERLPQVAGGSADQEAARPDERDEVSLAIEPEAGAADAAAPDEPGAWPGTPERPDLDADAPAATVEPLPADEEGHVADLAAAAAGSTPADGGGPAVADRALEVDEGSPSAGDDGVVADGDGATPTLDDTSEPDDTLTPVSDGTIAAAARSEPGPDLAGDRGERAGAPGAEREGAPRGEDVAARPVAADPGDVSGAGPPRDGSASTADPGPSPSAAPDEPRPTAADVGATDATAPAAPAVDDVSALFALARDYLARERWTRPPGDNAAEVLQRVLELEPGHAGARAGLDRIVSRYLDLADAAAADRRDEAELEALERARVAAPDDPGLAARIDAASRRVAEATAAPVPPAAVGAGDGRADEETILERERVAEEARRAHVSLLVADGDRLRDAGRLAGGGPRGSALGAYSSAFEIDPSSTAVRARLDDLATRLLELARRAREEGRLGEARELAESALEARPEDRVARRELDRIADAQRDRREAEIRSEKLVRELERALDAGRLGEAERLLAEVEKLPLDPAMLEGWRGRVAAARRASGP